MRKMKARPWAALLCRNLNIQHHDMVGIYLAGTLSYILGPFLSASCDQLHSYVEWSFGRLIFLQGVSAH